MELNLPNEDLANHLKEIATLYTLEKDTYRAKSFSEAAIKIEIYPDAIISGQDAKDKIKTGIVPSIAVVIDEYTNTGTSSRLQELRGKNQDRTKTVEMFRTLHGVGPVTANKFYDLGYRTFEDLWTKAALTDAQKLGIMYREHLSQRIPRDEMIYTDAAFHQMFPKLDLIIVGSYRRGEPDSGDIDILIKKTGNLNLDKIVQHLHFAKLLVGDLALGESKYLGIFQLPQHNAHRIDLLLIDPQSWGSALMYFTGSQRFNILMRQRAKDLNMRLNEYGLFELHQESDPEKGLVVIQTKIPTPTEEDIFNILRVKYLRPEERTRNLAVLPTY